MSENESALADELRDAKLALRITQSAVDQLKWSANNFKKQLDEMMLVLEAAGYDPTADGLIQMIQDSNNSLTLLASMVQFGDQVPTSVALAARGHLDSAMARRERK
jgi:hypothetical protein